MRSGVVASGSACTTGVRTSGAGGSGSITGVGGAVGAGFAMRAGGAGGLARGGGGEGRGGAVRGATATGGMNAGLGTGSRASSAGRLTSSSTACGVCGSIAGCSARRSGGTK